MIKSKPSAAFSLLEILSVIAIISVISAILIPTLYSARKSSLKTRSIAQFHQYILALESYYQEYGHYPEFFYKTPTINLNDFTDLFVKALSCHTPYPDCKPLTPQEKKLLNPKGISFHPFAQSEFNSQGKLIDAFGNTHLIISIDTLNRGVQMINGEAVTVKIAIYTQNDRHAQFEELKSW